MVTTDIASCETCLAVRGEAIAAVVIIVTALFVIVFILLIAEQLADFHYLIH